MSAGGSAPPSATQAAAANDTAQLLMNQVETRMGQMLDDADHHRCSEGNQRALLAEKLENLRRLTKELEQDDWKYAPKKGNNGSVSISNKFQRPSEPDIF